MPHSPFSTRRRADPLCDWKCVGFTTLMLLLLMMAYLLVQYTSKKPSGSELPRNITTNAVIPENTVAPDS